MNAADILAGGARLIRTQPKAVAIWGLLYFVLCGAMIGVIWPMMDDLTAFQQQAVAAQAAHLPPPPPPGGFFLAIFAVDGLLLLVMIAIFAAAVRAVALGGDDRFGFLRIGMDELRLLGLGVLLIVAGMVVVFVLGVVVGLVVAALAGATGGSPGAAVALAMVLMLVLFVVSTWLQIRLSLAGALTVLRGRIVVREAWRLTRGRFWTLFGVFLLIGIAYFAVTITLMGVMYPGLLSAYAGGMQPQAMQAALAEQQATLADPFGPRMIVAWVIGCVVMTVGVAFTFGAIATAAIGFDREDHAVPAEILA